MLLFFKEAFMNDITFVGKLLSTYNVSKHTHDTWELVYCTGGNGKFAFENGSVVEYKKGDIVLLPPLIVHENISSIGFTNIHMNIANATFPFNIPTVIQDDSEGHILSTFKDVFYFFHCNVAKKQLVISALGNLIANYVIAFRSTKPLSKLVEEIKADIVKNFPDPDYSLEEFMHTFPFSYDYLRKLFKSEIGTTPHGYLVEMRMQAAQKLLADMKHNEYNISMIAQMCGYEEPLYFSRVFKKHFGSSPSDYLNKKKEEN